jgi:hypothetical protein
VVEDMTEEFIRIVFDPASSEEQINQYNESFLSRIENLPAKEAEGILFRLSDLIEYHDHQRAAFVAAVCVYLLEQGCSPTCLISPMIRKLKALLQASERLFDVCISDMEQKGLDINDNELFEQTLKNAGQNMPEEMMAWNALDKFWPPAISLFSKSPEARTNARILLPIVKKLNLYQKAAHWLCWMIPVLHNEPVVVLEPATKLGIVGTISGIVDNYQLHMFLIDIFPEKGFFSSRKLTSLRRSVIDGSGPQRTEIIMEGIWNLYSWKGLHDDLTLPDPKDFKTNDEWIWGEGIPDDIPELNGHRVILLGPPSYLRTWPVQRIFKELPAEFKVTRKLSKSEVNQWLQKIADAKRS